jgi:S-adenosylmethionine-diacylglycerol 3-amino-3-carboxypropyl transferase
MRSTPTPTTGLLKKAVQHEPLMSKEGFTQRLFTMWFDGFVYNQIWEDPDVDLAALKLQSDSRILTISSGGCNVLNYLIQKPEKIVAVDLNHYHMQLTRLKLAALQYLPTYEAFFNFFGHANHPDNLKNYYTYIQPNLDAPTRHFWEGGSLIRRKLGRTRINYFRKNLYRYARFGFFMRFLHGIAKVTRHQPHKLLEAKTLEEQEAIFDKHIAPFFDNWLVKSVGNSPLAVFSLGIPPQQYNAMKKESKGKLLNLYRERVKRLACQFPVQDNYFAWQGFSLHYDTEGCQAIPEYLKREHYDSLKENLGRVETHVTTLADYMKSQPDNSLDRFVFLDSQDWMPDPVITEMWREIARVGRPGTRIIFRTASTDSPIETALPPDLRTQFVYEKEWSEQLFQQDRSAIYGGFHIYSKP